VSGCGWAARVTRPTSAFSRCGSRLLHASRKPTKRTLRFFPVFFFSRGHNRNQEFPAPPRAAVVGVGGRAVCCDGNIHCLWAPSVCVPRRESRAAFPFKKRHHSDTHFCNNKEERKANR
jgi:hypothetical protein